MRKAKHIVMGFLALAPLLWILLVCTTGIMGERADISTYEFGSLSISNADTGAVTYTPNSPAKAILSPFIPEGTAMYSDETPQVIRALYKLSLTVSNTTFPGVSSQCPNTILFMAICYLFYLFLLELINLIVTFVSLPIRLVSRWAGDAA